MQILALQFVEPRQLVLVLVDGSHATSAVAGQEAFALMVLDTQTLPQFLDGGAQLGQSSLATALLLLQSVLLFLELSNILLMQAQLLGRIAMVLDDCAVGLCLWGAQLGPQLDDFLGDGLDGVEAAVVFFVDTREFLVELGDVG